MSGLREVLALGQDGRCVIVTGCLLLLAHRLARHRTLRLHAFHPT
jgi:hypothetical protein